MAAEVATSPERASNSTEDTGGFSFFRKYQKHILYTAVLFALLTFSIPVALTSFFDPAPEFKGPTMQLGGRTIRVTRDDWAAGRLIARSLGDPSLVLPDISTGEDREDLADRFAALRRLAIESGIEVSEVEVDRAIEQAVKTFPQIETKNQIALRLGYGSLEAYRVRVREALRLGTFLRLQVAGVDTLDSAVAAEVLEDREKLVLTVATFDKKAEEERLKEKGVSDEDLQKWVDGLEEAQRRPFENPNRVALSAAGFVVDEFGPVESAAELENVEFTEEQLKVEYERRKGRLFRKPPQETPKEEQAPKEEKESKAEENQSTEEPVKKENEGKGGDGGQEPESQTQTQTPPPTQTPPAENEQGGEPGAEPTEQQATVEQEGEQPEPMPQPTQEQYFPFDEVKDALERRLLAEKVLDKVRFGVVEDAFAGHMLPAIEARNAAIKATADAREALADAEKKLEDDPEDSAREKAVETAEGAIEAAEEAEKEAAKAVDDRRREFDFTAQMALVLGGRKGFTTHAVTEPVESSKLEELGPFGTWENAAMVETIDAVGDLSVLLQSTDQGCFHFQVPALVKRPLKPFEDIADQARAEYFVKMADEAATEGEEKLEEALLEKAKEKIADKITELEKESAAGVEEDFTTWSSELEKELSEAHESLKRYEDRPKSTIFKRWTERVAELSEAFEKRDDKRDELEERAAKELEEEIEKEARKVYKDVLAEAVDGTGFVIEEIGPYPVDLSQKPRFQYRFTEKVRFLFGNSDVRESKAGEVTDVLDDVTGRAKYLAVCKSREKITTDDLTRRELQQARTNLVRERLTAAMQQSFSLEALEERWGYESPTPRFEEESARPGPEGEGQQGAKNEGPGKDKD